MLRLDNLTLGLVIVIAVLILVIVYILTKKPQDEQEHMGPVNPLASTQPNPAPKKTSPVLVLFKADWCPACQSFAPVWEQLKKANKGGAEMREISDQAEFAKHHVEGLPTVRYFPAGVEAQDNFINYNGQRTMDDMMKFLSTLR